MTASPTELTLRHLRDQGWPLVQVVEHWVPNPGIRRDLFGVIDVLAVGSGRRTLAIQATSARSRGTMSHRKAKLLASPATPFLLDAGWAVEIWGWHKPDGRWTVKIWAITRDMIEGAG